MSYRGSLSARVADEVAEVSLITTVADVADSLDGTYFILYSAKDETLYHVWFNTSGGAAVDPAPVGSTAIEVAIATGATAAAVADAAETAIDGVAAFSCPIDGDDDIEITNAGTGATTNVADFDTLFTPFTIVTPGVSGDVTVAQPIKVHGYQLIGDGAAEAVLNIWINDKTGNPLWSDIQEASSNKARPVDFSIPLRVGVVGDTVIFEVTGAGAVAYVRYD